MGAVVCCTMAAAMVAQHDLMPCYGNPFPGRVFRVSEAGKRR